MSVQFGRWHKDMEKAKMSPPAATVEVFLPPLRITAIIPQNDSPRYPAEEIIHLHPPTYLVTPPALEYTSISRTSPV